MTKWNKPATSVARQFGNPQKVVLHRVRHGAKAVFIVSNNAAWNIERYDQAENYGGRVIPGEITRAKG